MAEPIADGIYRDPVSGEVVHVRGGQVLLKLGSQPGKVFAVDPAKAGEAIKTGGYDAANAGDIAEHAAAARPTDLAGAAKTFARKAGTGIYEGATAVPRALGGVAEAAYGAAGAPMQGPSVSELSGAHLGAALGAASKGQYGAKAERKEAQAQAEEEARHPAAAFLGSLAGQTVGAAAGGLPMTGPGGAATKIAAGALEGAGFGGAQTTEEAYVHDSPLSGEKLIASMGPMALLGVAGAGLGAAGERFFSRSKAAQEGAELLEGTGLAPAGEATALTAEHVPSGPKGFQKWLQNFGEERATKALGARGTDIRKLGRTGEAAEENLHKMARTVLDAKLDDGTRVFQPFASKDELLSNVRRAEEESGQRLGDFRKAVWRHAEEEGGEAYRSATPDLDNFYSKVQRDIVEPLRKSGVAEVRSKAGMLENTLQEIRDLGPKPSLEELTRYRQDLASIIYPKPAGPGLPALAPAAQAELIQVERALESTIETATDKAAASMPGVKASQYLELKSKYRALKQARQIAEKASLQDLGNRVVSPSDYLTGIGGAAIGAAAHGGLGGLITGGVTGAIHHVVREHGSAVLAVLADRLSGNLDAKLTAGVDGLLGKSASGVAGLLEKTEKAAATVGRIGKELAPHVSTASDVSFAKRGEDKREAYVRTVKEIYRAADPMVATQRMARSLGGLYERAPQMAQAATDTATRGTQYLASKIPAGAVSINALGPSKATTAITDAELHRFSGIYAAVANPITVLDSARDGTLTQDQVDAVKNVYPQLFQQMQQKVQEKLASLKEPPPYATRLQLDLLLDLQGAGEPSMSPTFQRTLAALAQLQNQQQRPPPRPSSGRTPDVAPRYQSLSTSLMTR